MNCRGNYKTGSYVSSQSLAKSKVVQAFKQGKKIKFYDGFVVIDGVTYNGVTQELLTKYLGEKDEQRRTISSSIEK